MRIEMERQAVQIATEEQFRALMEEIDGEMQREDVPIPARQIQAISRVACRLSLSLPLLPLTRDASPPEGCYTDAALSNRILNWVDARYGDRLTFSFPTGYMALWVRDDLYRVRFPFSWGPMGFLCIPEQVGERRAFVRSRVQYVNLLDSIEGMTPALAKSLSSEEQRLIRIQFELGYQAQHAVRSRTRLPLVNETIGNLDSSVSLLFNNPPQPGLSKWESLQATEKLLKAYIGYRGEAFEQIHILRRLADHAARLGLPPIADDLLEPIQCSPGVRYGQPAVTAREAANAHHAALSRCAKVFAEADAGGTPALPAKTFAHLLRGMSGNCRPSACR